MSLPRFIVIALPAYVSIAGVAGGDAVSLPLHEGFGNEVLSASWTVDVSQGNGVRIKDGALEIEAAENTYAHIERPLGVDHVRASAAIQAGSGVSWATSLFLYWKPGDWCQLGIIPRGDGRYYVCVSTNGQRSEHDLARCRFADVQNVAIELGEDCIRFMSSADGQAWHTELFVTRPAALMGPPTLLIVGKGFGLDATTPDLDGDYGDRGPAAVSRVRDIRVEKTEPARMRITDAERRERDLAGADPLGRKIIESGEPSYDAVAAVLPALSKPREAVGTKDGRYEVGVEYDGTIQLDTGTDGWEQNGPTAWFEIDSPPVRFGASGCTKRLMDGFLPIVICEFEHDGLRFGETVLGWSPEMKPDAELWGYARLGVSNPSEAARQLNVVLRSKPEAISQLEPMILNVPAKGRAEVCIRIASPAKDNTAIWVEPAEFERRSSEVAVYWRTLLDRGMRITTPEQRVNDAWRAWLAYNFIDVDKKGDVYEPHDGSGFYELVYGYSAVLYAHALDLWGFHDDARRYLEAMFSFQDAEGLFAINYGLPDHGSLLFALAEHYRYTGDSEWLHRMAPKLVQMGDWLVNRRRQTTTDAPDRKSVTFGLIRFRPYCDYPEQTYNYYGNAYCCVGLEHAADVLREIGMSKDADRFADEAARYRRDILASMDAAVVERDGMRLLPMEPDTRRLLESTQYRGGGYYGLIAAMFLESEFLPPDDPRAKLVTEALERRHGLILGMSEFDGGVDHAYTYGYWLNGLRRDDINRVLLGFYGTLAYGMGRETYCGVEVTQITTGEPTPTTPHLYSGTQQLRLLRMMLLREEGDSLLLAHAIPRAWLADGRRIEVKAAPTTFGPVSFVIESAADTGRIDARIDPPTRRAPKDIRLCLRHPAGQPIARATINNQPVETVVGDVLILKPQTGPIVVQASY